MTFQEEYDHFMMSLAMEREAAYEPELGIICVGCVIRERHIIAERLLQKHGVIHPWGLTIADIVTKKAQFSSLTILGDRQTIVFPPREDSRWLHIMYLAEGIIGGQIDHPLPGATLYHADYMKPYPSWTKKADYIGQIGKHIFYHAEA